MDRKIQHKSFLRKKHLPFIVGGAAALLLLCWLLFGDHQQRLNVEKKLLTISEAKEDIFKDYVRVTATVAPIEVVQISAIEGGVVVEKCVEEGARIKKGDIIIRLDNADLDLQILNAEAELAEKQNMLRNTQVAMQQDKLSNELELASLEIDEQQKKRRCEQQRKLHAENLSPREDYLEAREQYNLVSRKKALINRKLRTDSLYRTAQMAQMEDNLANMRKNVLLVRERKARLEVRSTIDGELGLLDVKLGQNIAPGALIGQVNDLSAFRLEARIDEHYIDRVRPGLGASFQKDGKRYGLRVRKVFPEVREGKFRVEFSFENPSQAATPQPANPRPSAAVAPPSASPDSSLRIGQTFYLDLELGRPTSAIVIPRGTFFQTTGGQWIFVLSPDGSRAYKRKIRIGRQNPAAYEVLDGLEKGERVITSGYESFRDNDVLQLQ